MKLRVDNEVETLKDKVLDFLREHGESSELQIREALGVSHGQVRDTLLRLSRDVPGIPKQVLSRGSAQGILWRAR